MQTPRKQPLNPNQRGVRLKSDKLHEEKHCLLIKIFLPLTPFMRLYTWSQNHQKLTIKNDESTSKIGKDPYCQVLVKIWRRGHCKLFWGRIYISLAFLEGNLITSAPQNSTSRPPYYENELMEAF